MTRPKPVAPRFYFDADVLGLAKLVAQERADITYPGDPGGRIKKRLRPPCIITTPDNGAKMVNLASKDATNTWAQLEVLMTRWREVEALVDRPGPFIYIASRTRRLRPVDLKP